ncbi:ML domain-containing protein [Streptomyces sp. NPDC019224]|uniref:ML domain-containing protein n=1 Tax=Streptomyces sp. NPDC019224 TaxID=3154484 RepID=UPI0033DBA9E5
MSGFQYTDQGLSTDALQIDSITITPDPPKRDAVLKAVIKGELKETIEEGASVEVTVNLGVIRVHKKTYDLFEKLKGDTSDGWTLTAAPGVAGEPLARGPVEMTLTKDLKGVPAAKYTVDVRAYTVREDDLAALTFKVDLLR